MESKLPEYTMGRNKKGIQCLVITKSNAKIYDIQQSNGKRNIYRNKSLDLKTIKQSQINNLN